MANTYSWVISQLEAYPEHEGKQDVVFTVHWRRQATDGLHFADVYGSQGIEFNPDDSFISFSSLTQSEVEGWLEAAMGAERIADMDAALDTQIANIINPPVIRPALPWATA